MGLALRGVVVAKVVEVNDHPTGDRIWLARVTWDPTERQKHQIVFGGELMLKPGDLVPAAPPGSRLGERKKMRSRTYRGKRSHGMLCSTDELGWTVGGTDCVAVLRKESGFAVGTSLDDVAYTPDILVRDLSGRIAAEPSTRTPVTRSGAVAAAEAPSGSPAADSTAPHAEPREGYAGRTAPSPAEPALVGAVGV